MDTFLLRRNADNELYIYASLALPCDHCRLENDMTVIVMMRRQSRETLQVKFATTLFILMSTPFVGSM